MSVDDHVVEPPDIFDGRFPARFEEDRPRIVETDNGGQAWLWLDEVHPNIGINAVVGRPRSEMSIDPVRFEHMRRGAWDVDYRVKDMDIGGIWASLCFPSFLPGFVGQRLSLSPTGQGNCSGEGSLRDPERISAISSNGRCRVTRRFRTSNSSAVRMPPPTTTAPMCCSATVSPAIITVIPTATRSTLQLNQLNNGTPDGRTLIVSIQSNDQ